MATVNELVKQLKTALKRGEGGDWKATRSAEGWRVYRVDKRYAIQCTAVDGRVAWRAADKKWTTNPAEARLYARTSSALSAITKSVSRDMDGNYWSPYSSFAVRGTRASIRVVDAPETDLQKLAQVGKELT